MVPSDAGRDDGRMESFAVFTAEAGPITGVRAATGCDHLGDGS